MIAKFLLYFFRVSIFYAEVIRKLRGGGVEKRNEGEVEGKLRTNVREVSIIIVVI